MYLVESRSWTVVISHNGFSASVADVVASGDDAWVQGLFDGPRRARSADVWARCKTRTVPWRLPGPQLTFNINSGSSPTGSAITGSARVVLVKDRLYQLINLTTTTGAKPTMVQAFFAS